MLALNLLINWLYQKHAFVFPILPHKTFHGQSIQLVSVTMCRMHCSRWI